MRVKCRESVVCCGVEIVHLYLSPGHNYFGHYGRVPDEHPAIEVHEIECIARHGIRGDRFFDFKFNYKGQITFFALEVFQELCHHFGVHDKAPSVLRRNVITRRQDLRDLIGAKFEIQGVRFRGIEECRPCFWMDQAFGPGAEKFLRGRGGLRARILTSGIIAQNRPAMVPA
jgi:MOSC domain-containing protein YiiM